LRRLIVIVALLGVLVCGWLWWRDAPGHGRAEVAAAPTIEKQPVNFVERTFDPDNPPPDMPPFSPGEAAVCDSNFLAKANVGGEAEPTDSTHAIVIVTQVKVVLQLASPSGRRTERRSMYWNTSKGTAKFRNIITRMPTGWRRKSRRRISASELRFREAI
jgi:hypothetical protein